MVKRTLFAILAMVAILCATNLPTDLVSVASAQEAVIQSTASESDEFPRTTSCDGLAFTSMTVINPTGDATRVDIMHEVTPGDVLRFRLSQYESGYRMHDIQCNPKAKKVLIVYSTPYPGGHTQLRASMYDMKTLVWSPIEIPFLGVSYGWPQVEAISDGFLVSFAYYTGGANGQEVRGIIVGADGSVSDSFTIIDQASFQFVHDLACGPDDSCVVATQTGGSQIRIALWSEDGVKPVDLIPTGSYPLVSFDTTGRILLLYHGNKVASDVSPDPNTLAAADFIAMMTPTARNVYGQVFEYGNWSAQQSVSEGFASDVFPGNGPWIVAWHENDNELGPAHLDLLRFDGTFTLSNLATFESPYGTFGLVGHFPFRCGDILVAYSQYADTSYTSMVVRLDAANYLKEVYLPTVESD